MVTVTKRAYEAAEAEVREANREITALWLHHVKPAQERYENDPDVKRAARQRTVAERTIAEYKEAHPHEFCADDTDDDGGW